MGIFVSILWAFSLLVLLVFLQAFPLSIPAGCFDWYFHRHFPRGGGVLVAFFSHFAFLCILSCILVYVFVSVFASNIANANGALETKVTETNDRGGSREPLLKGRA